MRLNEISNTPFSTSKIIVLQIKNSKASDQCRKMKSTISKWLSRMKMTTNSKMTMTISTMKNQNSETKKQIEKSKCSAMVNSMMKK